MTGYFTPPDLRFDFHNAPQDAFIRLHPTDANFMHRKPVLAMRDEASFFCEGTSRTARPDYALSDVSAFFIGWELADRHYDPSEEGIEEGSRCNRWGCSGDMMIERASECSCHISPPCWACGNAQIVCDVCGAEA